MNQQFFDIQYMRKNVIQASIVAVMIVVMAFLISSCDLSNQAGQEHVSQNNQDQQNQQDLSLQNSDSESMNIVVVTNPKTNQEVTSPLTIEGTVPAGWAFEATFPVEIDDLNNETIAHAIAMTQTDWTAEGPIPFLTKISFTVSKKTPAILVLRNDNPSALPENEKEMRIPVVLMPGGTDDAAPKPQTTIKLFYYDDSKYIDKEEQSCSNPGFVAVERKIPLTKTPIQDVVRLLLKGELTDQEKVQGISTEYPLADFEFVDAAVHDGVVTLQFKDDQNKTSGGSLRASILWCQIENTVKQFSGVKSVKFIPEEIFQP